MLYRYQSFCQTSCIFKKSICYLFHALILTYINSVIAGKGFLNYFTKLILFNIDV